MRVVHARDAISAIAFPPIVGTPSITVVIPALNEEEGIGKTIHSIPRSELRKMGYDVQVLVVDNGSEDNTAEVAKQAGGEVVYEPIRGYGRAYKTGFAHARGDIIATADADLTYPVDMIPGLVGLLETEGLDLITTNRFAGMDPDAMSFTHKLGNQMLSLTTRILFQMPLTDSQSGMWIFRKSLLDKLKLRSDGMPLSEELKIEAGYYARCRWKEVPIEYRTRVGKVKLRFWQDGVQNLLFLANKRISR